MIAADPSAATENSLRDQRVSCVADLEREEAELSTLLVVTDLGEESIAPEVIARAERRLADKELELRGLDARLKRAQTMVRSRRHKRVIAISRRER